MVSIPDGFNLVELKHSDERLVSIRSERTGAKYGHYNGNGVTQESFDNWFIRVVRPSEERKRPSTHKRT